MELRQLRYFLTLAETLNFSRAAEKLYISQPTLSQQIAMLEEELNTKLFNRSKRKVLLTRAGQIYLEYAVRVFSILDEAQDKVRLATAEQTETSTFVIGVDESAPRLDKQGFFAAVEAFNLKFPNCRSYLKVLPFNSILSAIQTGGIDVCISIIMRDELKHLPLEHKVIGRQDIVLCVPKAFAARYPAEECIRKASEELELCLSSTDQRWANNFKRLYQRLSLPYHPLFINSYNSICTYVEAGRGAMLDTEFSVSSERLRFSTPIPFPRNQAEALDVLLWNSTSNHPMRGEFLSLFKES